MIYYNKSILNLQRGYYIQQNILTKIIELPSFLRKQFLSKKIGSYSCYLNLSFAINCSIRNLMHKKMIGKHERAPGRIFCPVLLFGASSLLTFDC